MVERFIRTPTWAKLVAAAVLVIGFGLVPMALRWPVRIVIGVLLYTGITASLFRMEGRPLSEWLWRPLTHPLAALIAVLFVSVQVKESFPLSHYPMYSNPRPEVRYFYLAKELDGEMEPVPIKVLCGISAAKLGKIYRAYRGVYCDEVGRNASEVDANEDDGRVIGGRVLKFMQELATRRGKWERPELEGDWGLVKVEVRYDGETRQVLEMESLAARRKF